MTTQQKTITYLDRVTKELCQEKVYGGKFLHFLYGKGFWSRVFGYNIARLVANLPLFSNLFGWWQRRAATRHKIIPFINEYAVDAAEFAESPSSFSSFNDFFIRKLKPAARPMAPGDDIAVIPADGRYLFYSDISQIRNFSIKGKSFSLEELLQNKESAVHYSRGAMAIARLCPSDYHRFHFPCDGLAEAPQLINGALWSVNPMALQRNVKIFSENKRVITAFKTEQFGTILYIEVGATSVGSIHQTYMVSSVCQKGDEKGYFSFGGSTLILLFEPGQIQFDSDLLAATERGIEIKCLLGQSMGRHRLRKD
jgi:phosphatidylserine decarboxylase